MAFFGFLLIVVGWVWSVARGIQVSVVCVVLNFLFPPIAQLVFALYEPAMRAPLLVMAAGAGLLYAGGSLTFN